jgi:hypothetical protein
MIIIEFINNYNLINEKLHQTHNYYSSTSTDPLAKIVKQQIVVTDLEINLINEQSPCTLKQKTREAR